MHKVINALNYLPKSDQAKAKQAPHIIWQAEPQMDVEKAFDLWVKRYELKYTKAAICLQKVHKELMVYYGVPAYHS